MKRILTIVHQGTSDTGLIGHILTENGYHLDRCCPALGDALPTTMQDHAGVIVFGGPMSANDDTAHAFIRAELAWIEAIALPSGKPYLGVCLGAQMLARVLGAQVAPHREGQREIGYGEVMATDAGRSHFPVSMQVYQWHKEGFELPHRAVLLAKGSVFANQAFRYGQHAYGVQFHPEITRLMIDRWTHEGVQELVLPGAQPQVEQILEHERHAAQVERWLSAFLQQWLVHHPSCSSPIERLAG